MYIFKNAFSLFVFTATVAIVKHITIADGRELYPIKQHENIRRIYAIGDIHGDFQNLIRLLHGGGLIKLLETAPYVEWSGGQSIIVQVGDIADRGPYDLDVYGLFRLLTPQIRDAGGEIHMIFGNHEVMNMCGDRRYLSSQLFSERFHNNTQLWRRWWGPESDHGAWIRETLQVYVTIDNRFTFVHAGLTIKAAQFSSKALKRRLLKQIDKENCSSSSNDLIVPSKWDGNRRSLASFDFFDPLDSPLWTRSFAHADEKYICPELSNSLHSVGRETTTNTTKFMIVGHTTTDSGHIEGRCPLAADGQTKENLKNWKPEWKLVQQLLMIDVGISDYCNPYVKPAMLEIQQTGFETFFFEIKVSSTKKNPFNIERKLLQVSIP